MTWRLDYAEDAQLEKLRGNLGTKDRVRSERIKMIILFMLEVDSHIWFRKCYYIGMGSPKHNFPRKNPDHVYN